MHRHQHKATRIVNNQGNMTPPKETNKTVTVDPKEMEIYELSDKEFKIILDSAQEEHTNACLLSKQGGKG